MDIISILVLLVIVGFVLWLVNVLIPMDGTIRRVITGLVLLLVFLYLLQALGIWHGGPNLRVR